MSAIIVPSHYRATRRLLDGEKQMNCTFLVFNRSRYQFSSHFCLSNFVLSVGPFLTHILFPECVQFWSLSLKMQTNDKKKTFYFNSVLNFFFFFHTQMKMIFFLSKCLISDCIVKLNKQRKFGFDLGILGRRCILYISHIYFYLFQCIHPHWNLNLKFFHSLKKNYS